MSDLGDLTDGARNAALGRHLRALRKQRGWSQAALRDKSGVSEVTIRSIESNYQSTRRRSRSTLVALSQAFGLPNDYLANYHDNPPTEDLRVQDETGESPLQQSVLDLLARGAQETLTRINEVVVPRLDRIETKLDMMLEALYPGSRNARTDASRPSDGDGDGEE